MHTGETINQLFAAVERAESKAEFSRRMEDLGEGPRPPAPAVFPWAGD